MSGNAGKADCEKGFIERGIDSYASRGYDSFHTPGHKGALCARDITEVGIGGEIFPRDYIEKAEKATAKLYGAKKIRYLVNGSSQGIKAALWAFKSKKVLFAPITHRAFTEGCELAGVNAISAREDKGNNGVVFNCGNCEELPPPLELCEAEKALDLHKDAQALFITSPDYLGRTADTDIIKLCEERGVSLIADSAHGAHFAFAPGLNKFRFDNGADFCNMSAHKTLGSFTQTALLAVNNPRFFAQADYALELLGTTSPNYVLLENLERAVSVAARQPNEYLRLKKFSERLRNSVETLENSDYTRLCVKPKSGTAAEAYGKLAEVGIMPEAVIADYMVFILTPYDSDEKLERLYKALIRMA